MYQDPKHWQCQDLRKLFEVANEYNNLQKFVINDIDFATTKMYSVPDLNYVHKELLRNGVNKKLLWTEYIEECRMNNAEPLMYTLNEDYGLKTRLEWGSM